MQIDSFITQSKSRFESLLKEFVEIPTVSMEPDRKQEIIKLAHRAVAVLQDTGFQAQLIQTKGNPIVFAECITNKSWKTLAFYNHLDVQPANPAEWNHSPFELTIEDGRYFGRGATDDKGPALTGLLAMQYAIQNKVPLNFQVIWELEEEIGSVSFEELFKKWPGTTKPDSVLVSDGIWMSKDQPSSEYALRGNVGISLTLETGTKDVHSGLTGGLARNPIGEICQVIAACYDAKTGKVKIPGFYKSVKHAKKNEVQHMLKVGFKSSDFKKTYELKSIRKMSEAAAVQSLKSEPTFEVHGIIGGYNGPGIKTIVPYQAEAKISMRIVPNQKVEEIQSAMKKFVKKLNPDVKVTFEKSLGAFITDPSGPHLEALKKSVKKTLNKELITDREGGSIGAVSIMAKHLKVPIAFFGISLPEHGYHAKNEYFDEQQFVNGIRVFTEYFKEIAKF